jgi:hypothetical protein
MRQTNRFLILALACAAAILAQPPGGRGGQPLPARQSAVIDITGYWVSQVNEDWRWRMVTPPKGDYASIPLNPEGKRVADGWDPAKDEASDEACRAYGAAGLMRLPTRLHITWQDDRTLKVETDAGQQTRLFHFDGSKRTGAEPQWQGNSVASWFKQPQQAGFGPPFNGPAPGKGGSLKIVTTHMRPGYIRKNGVPYSGNSVLTEYFDRVELDGVSYLILTSELNDPRYLSDLFLTSEQFKMESDGSKWRPGPCKAR